MELLLRGADYNVKPAVRQRLEEPGLVHRAWLSVSAPKLNEERREAILAVVGSITATVSSSVVLKLFDDPEEKKAGSNRPVP